MNQQVHDIIVHELTELNKELDYDFLQDVGPNTPLYGKDDSLDSLSLINFIMSVEKTVNGEFNVRVNLADPEAMTAEDSPYNNVGAFMAFVEAKLTDTEGS
ncbi:MAG: hypothetical protein ACR2PS_04630 [Pseudomonadales bacterium]